MPRKLANNRSLAIGRKPATGRQQIGFTNDGKIHVVLDTNVPINAIWALSKGNMATQTEKDCLVIINLIFDYKVTIGIDARLFKEYNDKAGQHLTKGLIKPEDVNYVLKIVGSNPKAFRMLVDPPKASPDPDDDILFDGLSADFLISDNLKDVKPERLLKGIRTPYANTVSPTQFVSVYADSNS